ncbi:hypothetical protein [Moraxella lacunata]|uniref:hypothetical protein n=1 Tax=Moraxella lacunata TaxID=477 RepID=UPI003EE061B7
MSVGRDWFNSSRQKEVLRARLVISSPYFLIVKKARRTIATQRHHNDVMAFSLRHGLRFCKLPNSPPHYNRLTMYKLIAPYGICRFW